MEWSEETIARLRVFWEEGLSTAEIGRRMGVSKNAVVGKAHRLSLTARPSPIRRESSGAPRPATVPRRIVGPTLPPLAAARIVPEAEPEATDTESHVAARCAPAPGPVLVAAPCPAAVAAAPSVSVSPARAPAPRVVRVAPPGPRPLAGRQGRLSVCCWPIGEPGTPSFRFCDAEATPGKPYCGTHAQLAYVKVRERAEDAA